MIQKLLDNRWQVLLFRDVAGMYTAAAKRPFKETWRDVFEVVTHDNIPANYPTDDFERSQVKGSRMPHRIASHETPEGAIELLVKKVLG